MTDPLGHVSRNQYNTRGLVTQITLAVGTADFRRADVSIRRGQPVHRRDR